MSILLIYIFADIVVDVPPTHVCALMELLGTVSGASCSTPFCISEAVQFAC
jgi:hypothetical protein